MTVLDTSGVVDLLLGSGAATQVEALLERERFLAAPDLVVFETLAVLRRDAHRKLIPPMRAAAAVRSLGRAPLLLFGSIALCDRAWALRDSFTMGDAIFIALAESLEEPLATKDVHLAKAAEKHSRARLLLLGAS